MAGTTHSEHFRVRSYEVEPHGRLRLVVLLRMLQETAWQHAKDLGKGYATRTEGSLFWVLSRLRVTLDGLPSWGDEFTITTAPVGIEKLFAVREFVLGSETESPKREFGKAKSGWLLVDADRGRPVRPGELLQDVDLSEPRVIADLTGVPGPSNPAVSSESPVEAVRHHDIDQYGHVNNAAYLEWVVDALPAETQARVPRTLDIDFLKETLAGDRYAVAIENDGDTVLCQVQSVPDSLPLCRVRLAY